MSLLQILACHPSRFYSPVQCMVRIKVLIFNLPGKLLLLTPFLHPCAAFLYGQKTRYLQTLQVINPGPVGPLFTLHAGQAGAPSPILSQTDIKLVCQVPSHYLQYTRKYFM